MLFNVRISETKTFEQINFMTEVDTCSLRYMWYEEKHLIRKTNVTYTRKRKHIVIRSTC